MAEQMVSIQKTQISDQYSLVPQEFSQLIPNNKGE